MLFKILCIVSYTLLYPYIVRAILTYFNPPPTETFIDCPEFETSDPWDSLTEEQYIQDILENSCEDRDCSDYEPRPFIILETKEAILLVITIRQEGRLNIAYFSSNRPCLHQRYSS